MIEKRHCEEGFDDEAISLTECGGLLHSENGGRIRTRNDAKKSISDCPVSRTPD